MAIVLLATGACGSPANNSGLFSSGGAGSSAVSSGGSASDTGAGNTIADAGTASSGGGGFMTSAGAVGSSSGGSSSGGSSSGGSSSGGSSSGGSSGGALPNGGNAGSAGSQSGGPNGGMGGGTLSDCSRFGPDATYFSATKHCYLAVHDVADFADARMHCSTLGGHLVTISDQAENDFVWELDPNEHWIGATDGKGPRQMNPGTYGWIDNEQFAFTDWSSGQPNAIASTCDDSDGPGDGPCYEHCAFQWSGGNAPGEWNDRLCSHTIEAVCEWDD